MIRNLLIDNIDLKKVLYMYINWLKCVFIF